MASYLRILSPAAATLFAGLLMYRDQIRSAYQDDKASAALRHHHDHDGEILSSQQQQQQQQERDNTKKTIFSDFSTLNDARDWIRNCCKKQGHEGFVKEVDVFAGEKEGEPQVRFSLFPDSNNNNNNNNDGKKQQENEEQQPPTQLQVWRLGHDNASDFPSLSRPQLLETTGFPIFGKESDSSSTKLSVAPVLRIVAFVPNASSKRVLSEITDPSRRQKWDSHYHEFFLLGSTRTKRQNQNDGKQSEEVEVEEEKKDEKWNLCSLNQEIEDEKINKNFKSHSLLKDVKELLNDSAYQTLLMKRMREKEDGNGEAGGSSLGIRTEFEFDYVRWSYHRIWSKMTSAFGMVPRISLFERIYGHRAVEFEDLNSNNNKKKKRNLFVRTAIDTSLPQPLAPSLPKTPQQKQQLEDALVSSKDSSSNSPSSSSSSSGKTPSAAVNLALRIAQEIDIPKPDDVPVHSHFQELLVFPVPGGSRADQIADLAKAMGKDDLSPELLKYYEKSWLPALSRHPSSPSSTTTAEGGGGGGNNNNNNVLKNDGVLFSFTTVNSTGLVGYPRWFERYIHKVFSTQATGNMMVQIFKDKGPFDEENTS